MITASRGPAAGHDARMGFPPSTGRRGFTLIELMVVIGVLLMLMGLGIPLIAVARNRSHRAATATVIAAIGAAIESHGQTALVVPQAGANRVYRLWDANGDGILDGDPTQENAVLPVGQRFDPAIIASGYRGAYGTLAPTVPRRHFDPTTGRILDAWRQPLRIAFALRAYAGSDLGIWSTGPDRLSDPAATPPIDDVRSWETSND